jgi:hypothetical protein
MCGKLQEGGPEVETELVTGYLNNSLAAAQMRETQAKIGTYRRWFKNFLSRL